MHGAKVSVRGTMDCPHFMPLYQKNLRETAKGTYKGDYQLVMEGQWIFNVVVRSERSGVDDRFVPGHDPDPRLSRPVATLGRDRSLGRARRFPRRAWIADYA